MMRFWLLLPLGFEVQDCGKLGAKISSLLLMLVNEKIVVTSVIGLTPTKVHCTLIGGDITKDRGGSHRHIINVSNVSKSSYMRRTCIVM
jgi:hypothetical protein